MCGGLEGGGAPGPLDPETGIIYHPPNLPGWDEIPLGPYLSEALGVPVFMEVDAGWYGHVEHRIHILAIEGQVLRAEADHTNLQAGSAQDSGFHSHPCSLL